MCSKHSKTECSSFYWNKAIYMTINIVVPGDIVQKAFLWSSSISGVQSFNISVLECLDPCLYHFAQPTIHLLTIFLTMVFGYVSYRLSPRSSTIRPQLQTISVLIAKHNQEILLIFTKYHRHVAPWPKPKHLHHAPPGPPPISTFKHCQIPSSSVVGTIRQESPSDTVK